MSKKSSATLIGAFVLGGIAITVAVVLVLGAGTIFRRSHRFVCYFKGTVNGLRIGSPVKFKGVELGSVVDVRLRLDERVRTPSIPVIVEIDEALVLARGGSNANRDELSLAYWIEQGLRARLEMDSFVTGMRYIALDVVQGSPAILVQAGNPKAKYQEIPVLPTTLEEAQDAATRIIDALEEIDFRSMADSVKEALDGLKELVQKKELRSAIASLDKGALHLDETLVAAKAAIEGLDSKADRIVEAVETSAATARVTLEETTKTLAAARQAVGPDSRLAVDVATTLEELSAAARSLRLLADAIERNPRAILFGEAEKTEE